MQRGKALAWNAGLKQGGGGNFTSKLPAQLPGLETSQVFDTLEGVALPHHSSPPPPSPYPRLPLASSRTLTQALSVRDSPCCDLVEHLGSGRVQADCLVEKQK
jgi:hypothetical protein